MLTVFRRLKVLSIGIALGALLLALRAIADFPSTWSFGQRVQVWGQMMSGPLFLASLGHSYPPTAVAVAATLAWLSSPLLFAYAVRPGVLSGALTLFALFWWFVAGWITMIMATWGA